MPDLFFFQQNFQTALSTCKTGYAHSFKKELSLRGLNAISKGTDWVLFQNHSPEKSPSCSSLCWAVETLFDPLDIQANSVNVQAKQIFDALLETIDGQKIEKPLSVKFWASHSVDGGQTRADNVYKQFMRIVSQKLPRISKLIVTPSVCSPTQLSGLFVYFLDYFHLIISRDCLWGGQHRVKFDNQAPSRSFLKIEEAYGILQEAPKPKDIVFDLGASPGGWSYSAAKHGAFVYAVDNGPLEAGAKNNPLIRHIKADAFKYIPPIKRKADWLFCDIVEHPSQVLSLVESWIRNKWCRHFIVNFKTGQTDTQKLLNHFYTSELWQNERISFLIRQLYHDRDELTLTGVSKL